MSENYPGKPVLSDWPPVDSGPVRLSGTAAPQSKAAPRLKFPWQPSAQPCSWRRGGGPWRGGRGRLSVWGDGGKYNSPCARLLWWLWVFYNNTYIGLSVTRGMSIKLISSPARFTKVSCGKKKWSLDETNKHTQSGNIVLMILQISVQGYCSFKLQITPCKQLLMAFQVTMWGVFLRKRRNIENMYRNSQNIIRSQ